MTRPTGQTTAQPTGGFNLSSQPTVGLGGGLTRPVQPSAVQPTATSAPGLAPLHQINNINIVF